MIEKRKWLPSDLERYAQIEGLDPLHFAHNLHELSDYTQDDSLLRLAGQVYTYPVRTPELWAQKAPPLYKDMLTIMDRRTLEMFFPGVTSGDYLLTRFEQNPSQYIPSPEMINSILFAGYESMEALQTGVEKKLRTFLVDSPCFEGMNGIDPEMGTHLVDALSVVVSHMSHDPDMRRTGELPKGHILRGLLEIMEFIEDINSAVKNTDPITKKIRPLAFFTPRTATGLLLTYMLHDFCEDSFPYVDEYGTPQEDTEYGGYVHASPEINLVVNSVVRPTSSNKYYPANNLATVDKQAVIPTDDVITSKVIRAIESLNIEKSDGNPLRKLVSDTILDRRQDTRLMPEQRLVDLFAILSKFFDRNDNLRTYPFKWDKTSGQYVNVPPEKMLNKIDEVLSQFDPMNLLVFQVFAGRNPFKKLSNFMRADLVDTTYALTFRTILKYFPTRIAAHMLMGLTHDEILEKVNTIGVPKVR